MPFCLPRLASRSSLIISGGVGLPGLRHTGVGLEMEGVFVFSQLERKPQPGRHFFKKAKPKTRLLIKVFSKKPWFRGTPHFLINQATNLKP